MVRRRWCRLASVASAGPWAGGREAVPAMGCNVSKDKADPEHRSKKKEAAQENGVHDTKETELKGEEDIIDTNDPEVQQAATKIQAAFRGSQARKTLTTTMQASAKSDAVESPTEEIDIDLTDPEVNQAAAKIQASFRGHKVRKEMKKPPPEEKQEDLITNVPKEEEDEVVDIDLSDPDVQKAATKIQASFRGHLVRKQTGEQK